MRDVISRTVNLLLVVVESFHDNEYNRRRTTRGRFADFMEEIATLAQSAGVSADNDVSNYQLDL